MDLPVTWLMNSIRNDMKPYLFLVNFGPETYIINIHFFYKVLVVG